MTNEQYLIEKLDDLAEAVGRIEGRMSGMPCRSHQTWMKDIDTTINGNGQPGFRVRLDRLEQRGSVKDRLLWALVGTFVTSIGAVCVALLT